MIDDDASDYEDGFCVEQASADLSPAKMKHKKLLLRQNQLVRENRRLRNSASFRIGKVFTRTATRPWLLLILPFSLIYLLFSIGMERLGRWPTPFDETDTSQVRGDDVQDCVVFFPTNGVGFGHFTRMYALAKRYKKYAPSTEIVFFTTMPTLHLLYNEGFVTYHVAGRAKHKDLSAASWNALVEEHLSLVLEQHCASTFIFDGAFPYRGMLNAIRGRSTLRKIWMRRGTFKKGSRVPVDSIAHFDMIVHPEDSLPMEANELDHGVSSIKCSPIVLLDHDELLPRDVARRRLNLPQEGRVVYVQLGAGRINDIDSEIRITVEALLDHEDVTVVVGESMLGERVELNLDRVVMLRDYPNSMYFNAFDATVQAGGYNSYHETRKFGLPALFFPNMKTGMDDQLARCKVAEKEGWGLVVAERNQASIQEGVKLLFTIQGCPKEDGTRNGATELYVSLTGHEPLHFDEGWMLPNAVFTWIEQNITSEARILEFGSGNGSQRLAKRYRLWSVEHDESWIGTTASTYIQAAIVENPVSKENGEQGWYDAKAMERLPADVALIIVDGPPGTIGRSGLLHVLDRLPTFEYLLIDDTDRPAERHLSNTIAKRLNLKQQQYTTQQVKANGDVRRFDILRREG